MWRTLRSLALAGLLPALPALATEGPPPILNPYRAASADGRWVLQVDPSDLLGRGPADYRMEREGRVAWTNRLPFTLWEAVVAADGRVAGYAYTHGWRGFAKNGYRAGMGEFIVTLLSPTGAIVRQQAEPREQSRYLHTPPNPLALGIRLEESERRFLVATADPDVNRRRERWTAYDLEGGRPQRSAWRNRAARRDGGPARAPDPEPTWTDLDLAGQGAIPLAIATSPPPALRAIQSFDFDESGHIAALRWEPPAAPALVIVGMDGDLRREIPLPFTAMTNSPVAAGPAHVGGGRFAVALSERCTSGRVELVWADAESGAVSNRAPGLPSVAALAGFPDGRVAALTVEWRRNSLVDDLHLLAPDGRILWSLHNDSGYGGRPEELLSPEDIACDGTNRIAVLDNIRHTLQFFDDGGRYVRTLDFDETWPRKPNYPTDLAPDRDGGFVVFDFNAARTLVRIDSAGRIVADARPRHPDGTPFRVYDGIKRSPRGDLWTCDGHTLLRLDESGVVARVLGPSLRPRILDTPGHTAVDPRGRVYVADQRTRVVHMFGPDGAPLGTCPPDAADLSDISSVEDVTVSERGEVFVAMDHGDNHVRFAGDGQRLGPVKIAVDPIGQSWHCAPTGDLCWVSAYHDVFLVQGLTQLVRTISRRADGRWLEYPGPVAHAPDGSAAILCHSQSNENTVVICGPDGTARRDIALPASWRWGSQVVFDGRSVFVRREGALYRYDLDGRPQGRWSLPPGARWDGPFLAAGGRELWFVDRDGWLIRRFQCP